MLDTFDRALLNEVQRDDSRSAHQLAAVLPLSPSAIARRLRRLRRDGIIQRSIAILARGFAERRLRALVFITLSEHANRQSKAALDARLQDEPAVQFCYDDMVAMIDCANMAEFTSIANALLIPDPTVRRYDAHFIRREVKFEPCVRVEADAPGAWSAASASGDCSGGFGEAIRVFLNGRSRRDSAA
jgi:DNA-binding Lrp family transcriptional regulator